MYDCMHVWLSLGSRVQKHWFHVFQKEPSSDGPAERDKHEVENETETSDDSLLIQSDDTTMPRGEPTLLTIVNLKL